MYVVRRYETAASCREPNGKVYNVGPKRELLYLVLVTTGLRQGELQSITIGNAQLDGSPAWLDLSHRDEKSGKGVSIPLRDDVAERLCKHFAERLSSINSENRVLSMNGVTVNHMRVSKTKKPQYLKEILRFSLVGVIGFEPTTLWSQTRCASQTAPHPDFMFRRKST